MMTTTSRTTKEKKSFFNRGNNIFDSTGKFKYMFPLFNDPLHAHTYILVMELNLTLGVAYNFRRIFRWLNVRNAPAGKEKLCDSAHCTPNQSK
jgi:hypothetical protein